MSGTPRKRERSSVLIPWDEAVIICGGDETRLLEHRNGRRRSAATITRYKTKGVPIQELGEALLEWWRREREPSIQRLIAKGVADYRKKIGKQLLEEL